MELNDRTRELIAVGASVAANDLTCLDSHRERALVAGADPEEVSAAIEIGNSAKERSAAGIDRSCPHCRASSPMAEGVVMEANGYQFLGP